MTTRQLFSKWYIAVGTVLLAVAIAACSPFGGQKAVPTPTPPPTETPLPVLPTYTPTTTAVASAAQPTATRVVAAQEKPTLTPTTAAQQPQEQPTRAAVGGGEPRIAPVTIKVTTVPGMGNVLKNGSFEDGFENGVGTGWSKFDNGSAVYAWLEELQPVHVSHGQHAQLMRIMGPAQPDRFVGIYQTVEVIAGQTYTLSLHGIIRSSTGKNQNYGHRMQWAVDYQGRGNWTALKTWEGWTDTGWNDVPLEKEGTLMNAFVAQITPTSSKITLFIRGWTKWPIMGSEAQYYVDGVFLEGPVPGQEKTITVATQGGEGQAAEGMPTTGGSAIWIPVAGIVLVMGFAFWEIRKAWARQV